MSYLVLYYYYYLGEKKPQSGQLANVNTTQGFLNTDKQQGMKSKMDQYHKKYWTSLCYFITVVGMSVSCGGMMDGTRNFNNDYENGGIVFNQVLNRITLNALNPRYLISI